MKELKAANAKRIQKNLTYLTESIGPRLAGSKVCHDAIEWVAERFIKCGGEVELESFPVNSRAVESEKLELYVNGKWQTFPCSLFGSAPGTKGKTLTGKIVFFAPESDFMREDLSYLTGKAVLMWGSHIERASDYERLIKAKPAFLMVADTRYPSRDVIADGLFPANVSKYGAVPTVNIPYLDAWDSLAKHATKARLCIKGGLVAATGTNVICTLPGANKNAGIIYFGCHLDTQADCPGADDNGSGVAALLELAKLLAPLRRRHTIKLIAFDAEEQLSVGSASYARKHRTEIREKGIFMFNLDSIASLLGFDSVEFHTDAKFRALFATIAEKTGYCYAPTAEISPYSDHFPFCAAGLSALWIYRPCCSGGRRFFHHQTTDDMAHVDCKHIAEIVNVAADLVNRVAHAERIPFGRQLPEEFVKPVEQMWKSIYGGWEGLAPLSKELLG